MQLYRVLCELVSHRTRAGVFAMRATWCLFSLDPLIPTKEVTILARLVLVPGLLHQAEDVWIRVQMRDVHVGVNECSVVLGSPIYKVYKLLAFDSVEVEAVEVVLSMLALASACKLTLPIPALQH
jgi:hypothetical protein